MGAKNKARNLDHEICDDEMEEQDETSRPVSKSKKVAKEHKEQLQRLQEKDPEFFKFLQEHDKELLEFDDDDIDDDVETDMEDAEMQEDEDVGPDMEDEEEKPSKNVITTEMVDSWCNSIRENGQLGAVRSLMKAFRIACHYGDDAGEESSVKFHIMSSSVFNKIMLFVLSEMDGILRKLLKLPSSGGKKETITDLMHTKQWKKYNHLVKSYLGNSLHVLNQMTDTEMISFTLRRLKFSSLFLAAFPSLLRKYVKHIQFLSNCVVELLGVDLPSAYQHAFVFIRQLAMILRDAFNVKTKEAFRKVYEWKFINCLELWTGAVCAYCSEADMKPLAYPLTQIISGVARLVPTARYFPLRLRCVRMLNRIAASTGTFIPVSMLLLDMLEMKELNRPPSGGVGKAVDLRTVLKVSKPTLKTRAFQEACVYSVVEELAEHLAQWSYSVAFFELSFIPSVRLRDFCKSTKVERFRKEMRQLIRQVDANSEFTNERRMSITFQPNNPSASFFLEDEKKAGSSPLSRYVAILRQRARQRNDSLMESSVLVGEKASVFGSKKLPASDEEDDSADEQGATVFSSSSWLPGSASKDKPPKEEKKKKKRRMTQQEVVALEEDIVEDLVLSSDEEDGSMSDAPADEDGSASDVFSSDKDDDLKPVSPREQTKKRKLKNLPKKNVKSHAKQSKKRKRAN
ncbi:hypothetical protein CUMW_123040 [Citrus unshiu]|uniref:Nucleolar complex protein 2 homolog n=1 Tax=Citrus unshiu TaxID=55188 RepID=A0A2H5PC62_CITUN|nr:hypothetical protein CUMW_123040 [Citrus unshiu]